MTIETSMKPSSIKSPRLLKLKRWRSDSLAGHWVRSLLILQGSVLPNIWQRVLFCGLFGEAIAWLYTQQQWRWLHQSSFSSLVPSIVLGLLLVFRTNTAYDRFWEGRRSWGTIVNSSRNLCRQMLVAIDCPTDEARSHRDATMRLLPAFAFVFKQQLRYQSITGETIADLVSPQQYGILQQVNHPALEITVWIEHYLQEQRRQQRLDTYQLGGMVQLIGQLVDSLGACERILKTPMPLAYSIHLRQLLLIYCLAMPFSLVKDLSWMTGPLVALVSFMLLGIEEIGLEIENPFGSDPNDLPLNTICETLRRNVEDLIQIGAQGCLQSETLNHHDKTIGYLD